LYQVHQLDVSVPINTGIEGGVIRYESFQVAANISYNDFRTLICERMGLDFQTAQLGYKFSHDLRGPRASNLATSDDFRRVISEGVKRLSRARTRRVILEITNLVCLFLITSLTQLDVSLKDPAPLTVAPRKTRKHKGDKENQCIVGPVASKHKIESLLNSHLTSAMAAAAANIQINFCNQPPLSNNSNIGKQHFNVLTLPASPDIHIPASRRLLNGDSSTTDMGAIDTDSIHEVVHPEADIHIPNSSATDMGAIDTDPVNKVVYPEVGDALHDAHLGLPAVNFPALADTLIAQGIKTVEDLAYADRDQVIEAGVPEWAVNFLKDQARAMMILAEGGSVSAPRFYY
jgi:hypothetical protein